MSDQSVTVTIPDQLYRRLRLISESTHRPIAEILLESAAAMLPLTGSDADLSPQIADELAALHLLSDTALWQATEATLSPEQQARLSDLNRQQGDQPLTPVEEDELGQLLAEYDRSVLRRAQALALLAIRGHSIPDLNLPSI